MNGVPFAEARTSATGESMGRTSFRQSKRADNHVAFANYSSVVVLGDSYSDDNHRGREPLSNLYAPLGDPPVVWTSFLQAMMAQNRIVGFFNYAYNGAFANKRLTNSSSSPIPDTRQQMQQFFNELSSGAINLGIRRTLVVWWIGVNPLDSFWITSCQSDNQTGVASSTDPRFIKVLNQVDKQVEEIWRQIAEVRAAINKTDTDYMIMNIPYLDEAPMQQNLAQKWSSNNSTLSNIYLELLDILIDRYNKGLQAIVDHATKLQNSIDNTSTVKLYDAAKFWDKVLSHRLEYGIFNTNGTCYKDKTVCQEPEKYFFWDDLHMSPHVQRILAHDVLNFISS
ncbi:hypothetical protein O181_020550 [Austropuccinia psidii MF-1]|uniref:Carbohydrate esterase family 16 protein n=1 Tax=Austropuccinia psidii MF-1 TaxID=1389203 RepID=A0A9Q3GW76_9BASI|nr:hypothetical protein [Austropuccinia psidii MF-1]